MEFLIVIEPASGGRYEHRVAPGSYVLGREEASCDIAILSPEVSRQHARIHLSAEQCTVEDLGSTAGTSKDGQAIEGKQSFSFPVEISLGTTRLTVSISQVVEMSFDSAAQAAATLAPGSAISFHPAQPSASNASAEIGHYTKGREIARGGMGAILEANDRMLGRTVAMKVVLEERASEDARVRFIREATVLGQLEHPNIIPIHELGKDEEGNLFYAMKMVEGRTLQAIINDLKKGDAFTIEHYSLDRLLTIFRKVCDAMAFAHSKGIVHRDLKPENVMVGAFGEVLVMDWGLAKILKDVAQTVDELEQQHQALASPAAEVNESALPSGFQELSDSQMRGSSEDLTMDGAVMGSPQYMPPEQADGHITEINERSDIYSLGGILYAILTLRPPVRGKTVLQVLENVKSGNIAAPTAYNPGGAETKSAQGESAADQPVTTSLPHCPGGRIPSALSAVAMKGLAQIQADRYASVGDINRDVERFQTGRATSAEAISFLGQFLLLIRRNARISATIAISVALLTAATVEFIRRINTQKQAAVAAADKAREESDRANQAEAQALQAMYAAQVTLAGEACQRRDWRTAWRILDKVPEPNRDTHWEYFNRMARGQLHATNMLPTRVRYLLPHPTKPSVFGLNSLDNHFHLVDVRNKQRLLKIAGAGGTRRLFFSPDGATVGISDRSKVSTYRITDGKLLRSMALPALKNNWGVRFDDSGKNLIILSASTVRSVNGATGRENWKAQTGPGATAQRGIGQPFVRAGSRILLIDTDTGKTHRDLGAPTYPATAVALSPDSSHLVYADNKGFVRGIEVETGRVVFEVHRGNGSYKGLLFLHEGKEFISLLILTGHDASYSIEVRSAKTGQVTRLLSGGAQTADSFAVHPLSGEVLTSGSEIWDPTSPNPAFETRTANRGLWRRTTANNTWSFLDKDTLVYLSAQSNTLACLDLSTGNSIPPLAGLPDAPKTNLDFSRDRAFVFSDAPSRWHSTLALARREGNTFAPLHEFTKKNLNSLPASVFRLHPSGKWVYVADRHRSALYEASTGKIMPGFSKGEAHSGVRYFLVRDAEWLGDSKRMIAVTYPSSIYAWDVHSESPAKVLTTTSSVDTLACAPDGKRFVVAGSDRILRIHDGSSFELLREIRAHSSPVTAVAWHPSKPIIASGSRDLAIRLWNSETGAFVREIYGLTSNIQEIRFSPDGEWMAVSCDKPDRTLAVWRTSDLL